MGKPDEGGSDLYGLIGEVELKVFLSELQTENLHSQIASYLRLNGRPDGPAAEKYTAMARAYIADVPQILMRIVGLDQSADLPADQPESVLLARSAARCFLDSETTPDNHGLGGLLDKAYLVHQMFPQENHGEAHQLVRSLLGNARIQQLDERVRSRMDSVLGADAEAAESRATGKAAPPDKEVRQLASRSGSLDHAFNQGGIVLTSFGESVADARAVAVQEDGCIIVAGAFGDLDSGHARDVAVARYTSNGSLDERFADGGRTTIGIRGSDTAGHAVAVQADGKIVVVGESLDVGSNSLDAIVMRLNEDGSLDTTFNGNGIVITEFLPGLDDKAYAVAVQNDGRIVIGGYTTENTAPEPYTAAGDKRLRSEAFALARHTSDGGLDETFGESGFVITRFPGDLARVLALCVDAMGRILAAGLVRSGRPDANGATDLVVVRYLPDGKVDPAFGTRGHATIDIDGTDDTPEAIAVQPDGRIIVAGSAVRLKNKETNFLVVRLVRDGELDSTFNGSGIVITEAFEGIARAVALQEDGCILVTGYGTLPATPSNGAKECMTVARYLGDGKLDPEFGNAGVAWLDLAGDTDRAYCCALQKDSKMVVAGTSRRGSVAHFAVVRLLTKVGES